MIKFQFLRNGESSSICSLFAIGDDYIFYLIIIDAIIIISVLAMMLILFRYQVNKSQLKLVLALTDIRDSYTADHGKNVRDISLLIYKNLNKKDKLKINKRHLASAALGHDCGKIHINTAVLLKPGKLTDEERKEIQQHIYYGEKIMLATNNPVLAKHVLLHHEKFNSPEDGYIGLSGDEITLEAKIICVADCFSAMTSNRVYSEAMTIKAAIKEIQMLSGSHFDPLVVEAFLKIKATDLIKLNMILR